MNKSTSNTKITLFLMVIALESLAANFAHPVTPTIIKSLNLPDYMFGVAFAGMAFTNFLFSPFWANMVSRLSSRLVLLICCCGYGGGQILFMLGRDEVSILFARLVSGLFVGGIFVAYLTYIINEAPSLIRGKYLALNATFQTVFGAFGYLVGGYLGLVSIPLTFMVQAGLLILSGILFYLIAKNQQEPNKDVLIRSANPFKSFLEAKDFMNKMFFIIFIVVFITSSASTAYEQNFNYYIKDIFGFTSNYNGMLKAGVGFISLIANTTICMWIMDKKDVKKTLVFIFMLAFGLLELIFINKAMLPFIIINIVYFGINAIYIPLLQDVVANCTNHDNANQVMGFYNAVKSMGMVAGALFAGFIYAFGAGLTFLAAGLFFLASAIIMELWRKKY